MSETKKLIEQFATEIVAAAKREALSEFIAKFNGPIVARTENAAKKHRRKGPIQLCPVPRCTSPAAPIFGMLCAKHKATPKKLVAQYRAARRRAKKAR